MYPGPRIEPDWSHKLIPMPTMTVAAPAVAPVTTAERSSNPLRPTRMADVIGQDRMKRLLTRVLTACERSGRPLDHMLLVGPSGVGKSTWSHVIAAELGVDVYEVEAPVSIDTLLTLRDVMRDRDILRIEEIHQQAVADRRGRSSNTQPEVLYAVMEDRTITSGTGVLPFPAITVIGTTTDEGLLPDAFINRFPLRPQLDPYTEAELMRIAAANAAALGIGITVDAAIKFARASRGVPRQINNYVRNAATLELGHGIDGALATEVLDDLNRVTEDGLTLDMQRTLTFLYTRGKRRNGKGVITYQASIGTIATAIGKSRDSKAVTLRVEPYLIEKGFLQVGHGGRSLTPAGVKRAKELLP